MMMTCAANSLISACCYWPHWCHPITRWRAKAVPDEDAFESIKAGVDALPPGVKMFLNSGEKPGATPWILPLWIRQSVLLGEFYDSKFSTGNLELLARFYEKYPDYADKTFLSVKGGIQFTPSGVNVSATWVVINLSIDPPTIRYSLILLSLS